MRKYRYFVAGVFILGLVFSAGNSFSQFNLRGGVLYSRPEPKCLASVMISSELKSPQGDYLAEISDLVIDLATGHVSSAVLARVQGMGAKGVVIPFSAVTKAESVWRPINLPNSVPYIPEEFHRFTGEVPSRDFNLHPQEKPEGRLTASKLIGAMLRDSKGKDLGQIDDLIVDHTVGRVISFIVSGIGGRSLALPFAALSESGKGGFSLKSS